jgi:hypothetical protein
MTKFNGKNNLKTKRLAFERANYQANAFKDDPKQVTDFNFAERTFYGRVNRMIEPVIVREEFLSPIITSSPEDVGTHLALNFAAEQFKDLELHFAKACRMGVIPVDDPVLSSLTIKNSYKSPMDEFLIVSKSSMSRVLNNFVLQNKKLVNNFDDFVNVFMEFYLNSDNSETLTLSDFMKSKNSNLFMTGMAIDIGGISFSNDIEKRVKMFDSPAFNYYLNLAKQYGFHVNLQNPGVLVVDVASPVTIEYRKRLLLPTVSSIFEKQYEKTIFKDLDLLEKLLLQTYNSYVSLNPYNTYYKACNNKTVSSIVNIKNKSSIDYNKLLILYINMKNFFEDSAFDSAALGLIQKTAVRIGKHDQNKAMIYIEDQFRALYNQKDGSLTYFEKRANNT